MKLAPDHSLSLKLLRVVLLTALSVGVVTSGGLIFLDLLKTREQIDRDAVRILALFRDPATQALQRLDRGQGLQVVEGLLRHEAVGSASLGTGRGKSLAARSREPPPLPTRWLTDPLFGPTRRSSLPLYGQAPGSVHYGDLQISLDTAAYGRDFLFRALAILSSSLLSVLALPLVLLPIFRERLSRPLRQLIGNLAKIDPDRPGASKLPMLKGHEGSELGQWIKTVNQLLSSIERNTRLRHEAESSLQRMAHYDPLTGLPNRQHLLLLLDHILEDATRRQRRVAVLCVGLDDFKGINEQFSYQVGDELLVALADRLGNLSAGLAALARLGSDRFVLVQTDIEQPYLAAELAQSILDDLQEPFSLDFQEVRLRATIGITLYPEDGRATEKLLQKAEQTMTLAKRAHHRYQFYIASVDSEMRRRRELEKDLREALPRRELHLYYQPQLSYLEQRVLGAEALLRWEHPDHGQVPPEQFIPLAEQNGCIIAIGEWVLEQACRQLRAWHDAGFRELHMAVNLSAVQLRHAGLPRLINRLLHTYQLPAGSLELEVTETSLMEDIQTAAGHLLGLRRSGARIAIDDFGTGYSSLSYLKSLPLDKIKIDKSFVCDLGKGGRDEDATIVRTIIQLGKSLDKQITAEGVETVAQEAYLIDQGCHEGQGYLYSEPLSACEFSEFIRRMQRHPSPAGEAT